MAMNKQGQHYLSVKELRDKLQEVDGDLPVCYQRIEDVYFIKHNWQPKIVRWENWETTEAIEAFGCNEDKDARCFFIYAHY